MRRIVTLVEALDHARTRTIARSQTLDYGGEAVTFTDGTVVIVEHEESYEYSTYTADSGSTTFYIEGA